MIITGSEYLFYVPSSLKIVSADYFASIPLLYLLIGQICQTT